MTTREDYSRIDQSEIIDVTIPRNDNTPVLFLSENSNIESNDSSLRRSGRHAFNTMPDEPWSPGTYFSVRVSSVY